MPSLRQPRPAGPTVEIALCAKALRNMDFLSQSDAFVVLFTRGASARTQAPHNPARVSGFAEDTDAALWAYHAETEVVWDCLSPRFARRIYLPDPASLADHAADDTQLRFEVYDADTTDPATPLASHDFIGALTISLASLLEYGSVTADLHDKRRRPRPRYGSLLLSTERYAIPVVERPLALSVGFARGCELPPGESLFYVLSRETRQPQPAGATHWVTVHRSGAMAPPKDSALSTFSFQDADLTELAVTAGDETRFLVLDLFLSRANGNHVLAGSSDPFSLRMVKVSQHNGVYAMHSPEPVGTPVPPGVVRAGELAVSAQIIPEARDSAINCLGSSPSLRSVGSTSLSASLAHNRLTIGLTKLTWTPQSRSTLRSNAPGGGLMSRLKIKSARI
jgi:C2 domain